MDSSAPSILPPRVHVYIYIFSIYTVQIVYFSLGLECEKNENKQKEAGIGPFFKNNKKTIDLWEKQIDQTKMQRDKALQSRVKKAKCSNTKIERVRERRKQSVATQR